MSLLSPHALTGWYVYRANERPEIAEPFTITTTLQGERIVRCERISANGQRLFHFTGIEAPSGKATYGFWQHRTKARYVVEAGTIRFERRSMEGAVKGELALNGALFYPLMRCFTGSILRAALKAGGQLRVIVPDMTVPEGSAHHLLPLESERSVTVHSIEDCAFLFGGGPYAPPATMWLDGDTLTRYTWHQPDGPLWDCTRALQSPLA